MGSCSSRRRNKISPFQPSRHLSSNKGVEVDPADDDLLFNKTQPKKHHMALSISTFDFDVKKQDREERLVQNLNTIQQESIDDITKYYFTSASINQTPMSKPSLSPHSPHSTTDGLISPTITIMSASHRTNTSLRVEATKQIAFIQYLNLWNLDYEMTHLNNISLLHIHWKVLYPWVRNPKKV